MDGFVGGHRGDQQWGCSKVSSIDLVLIVGNGGPLHILTFFISVLNLVSVVLYGCLPLLRNYLK